MLALLTISPPPGCRYGLLAHCLVQTNSCSLSLSREGFYYLVLVERSDIPLSLCQIGGTRSEASRLQRRKKGEIKKAIANYQKCKVINLEEYARDSFDEGTYFFIVESSNIKPAKYLSWTVIFFKASILEESWARQQQVTAVLCLDSRPYFPSFRKFLQFAPTTGRPGLNHHTLMDQGVHYTG
jgi:hypothetical protein